MIKVKSISVPTTLMVNGKQMTNVNDDIADITFDGLFTYVVKPKVKVDGIEPLVSFVHVSNVKWAMVVPEEAEKFLAKDGNESQDKATRRKANT